MPKTKSNDELVAAFLADVLTLIPEDRRATVKEALEAEPVKAKVKDSVLARADYSRMSDELREQTDAVQAEVAEARRKIAQWTDWYGTASTEFATVKDQLDLYEQRFGRLDGNTPPRKPGVTKEELVGLLDEALIPRDAAAIDVADVLTDLKIEYREKFGSRLDSKALIKFANDNRLPLDKAYGLFVAPKVEELRQKDFDTAIAKAREDGAREALTSHKLPVISTGSEPASWERPKDTSVGKTPHDRVAAAVAGWGTGQ